MSRGYFYLSIPSLTFSSLVAGEAVFTRSWPNSCSLGFFMAEHAFVRHFHILGPSPTFSYPMAGVCRFWAPVTRFHGRPRVQRLFLLVADEAVFTRSWPNSCSLRFFMAEHLFVRHFHVLGPSPTFSYPMAGVCTCVNCLVFDPSPTCPSPVVHCELHGELSGIWNSNGTYLTCDYSGQMIVCTSAWSS